MGKMVSVYFILTVVCFTGLLNAQVGGVDEKKKVDKRVEKLLKEAELEYQVDDDGDFRLVNKINEERTQLVWVLSNTSKLGALEIRDVWSIAYRSPTPFSAEIANKLLKQNSEVKLGAWQISKMGDSFVAIFQAQIAAETDKISLMLALHAVTVTADEMEKELTGKDDF